MPRLPVLLRALPLLFLGLPAQAQDVAGEFDYWVLSLTWSPAFCALEGRDRDAPQCDEALGWVLHGLWPQYEAGWPSECRTTHPPPSDRAVARMDGAMGDAGLARHEWRVHGTCSGLSADDYLALSLLAWDRVARPEVFARLSRPVTLPASVIEEAFLKDNPGMAADGLTVTCREGRIREVRICLTRDLEFRRCGADVVRDCTLRDALLDPP